MATYKIKLLIFLILLIDFTDIREAEETMEHNVVQMSLTGLLVVDILCVVLEMIIDLDSTLVAPHEADAEEVYTFLITHTLLESSPISIDARTAVFCHCLDVFFGHFWY